MIVTKNAPFLRESIQSKLDLLLQGLNNVKDATKLDDYTKKQMDQINQDAKELEIEIREQDQGTDFLQDLKKTAKDIQNRVESHKLIQLKSQLNEESKQKLKDLKIKYEAHMASIQNEIKKRKNIGWWQRLFGDNFSDLENYVKTVLRTPTGSKL